MYFDGTTASCLQPFGLPGGKKRREAAHQWAIRSGVHAAGAGRSVKGLLPFDNPQSYFKKLKRRRSAVFVI